jgi:hypothetical protein
VSIESSDRIGLLALGGLNLGQAVPLEASEGVGGRLFGLVVVVLVVVVVISLLVWLVLVLLVLVLLVLVWLVLVLVWLVFLLVDSEIPNQALLGKEGLQETLLQAMAVSTGLDPVDLGEMGAGALLVDAQPLVALQTAEARGDSEVWDGGHGLVGQGGMADLRGGRQGQAPGVLEHGLELDALEPVGRLSKVMLEGVMALGDEAAAAGDADSDAISLDMIDFGLHGS